MASTTTGQDVSADALIHSIKDGPQGPRVGAFFDLDGSAIHGYSATTFFRDRIARGEMGPLDVAQAVTLGLRGVQTAEDFDAVLAASLKAWEGRSVDELDELGERLFRQKLAATLYPEAFRLISAHQRAGHTVVLATAATQFQVEPIARELGIVHTIHTPVEIEGDVLTGRAGGPAPFGPGKAVAVRAFARSHRIGLKKSYAYSNGAEDVPMLEAVGHPRAINPDAALERIATELGWPVRHFGWSNSFRLPRIVRSAATFSVVMQAFGVGVVFGGVNRSRRMGADLGLSLASDLGLASAGVDVSVIGREHLWSDRPAVFVFNHQSGLLDGLVLLHLIRSHVTGVAKAEAARIPGFGQFFRFADVAFVDRGNTTQAVKALEPAVQRLREGVSLAMSPEGTRSHTPRLGPFKKGPFHVAMQAGVPIVPIVLRNTGELMPRNSYLLTPGTVDVVVHPPIPTDTWTPAEIGDRTEEVRDLFVATLADWPTSKGGPA